MTRANLFICLTPLQALIAQSLIRQTAPIPADLLMVCYAEADNAKFHHYFQTTAALCRQADYVLIPQQRWKRVLTLPKLLNNLHTHYATVFVASIDNPNVQYPLSHLQFERLETFDDGTANLCNTSCLYQNPEPNYKRKFIKTLQRIRYQTEDLRRLSQQHHTLYPKHPNIIENTHPISLWQPENSSHLSGCLNQVEQQKILLGQPLFKDEKRNIALAQSIMQHFQISRYFPHPRETMLPDNIEIISTPLIFEDWLIQQIQQQPETPFHIYHLTSTAALNVMNFPNVHIHAIRPNLPEFQQAEIVYLYELMQQLSIPISEFQP